MRYQIIIETNRSIDKLNVLKRIQDELCIEPSMKPGNYKEIKFNNRVISFQQASRYVMNINYKED